MQDLAKDLSVPLNSNEVSTKRIGRIQEHTVHQFLLVKFKDVIKKKEFLRNSGKLRNDQKFENVFISPDLTFSERTQQYHLRVQKRELECTLLLLGQTELLGSMVDI